MGVLVLGVDKNPPPLAPTLLSPVSGAYADLAQTPSFSWQYNAGQGGLTQNGWLFNVSINGSQTQYFWNALTGAFQTTPIYNGVTSGTIAFGTIASSGNTWTYTFPSVTTITNITYTTSGSPSTVTVTAPNSFLNGQYVTLSNVQGIVPFNLFSGNAINGTHQVISATSSAFTFTVTNPPSGTYIASSGRISASFYDGNQYQWAVASRDTNGQGVQSLYNLVTAQQAPVVTVTPMPGTISTAQPTISWSVAFAPGATQLTYQVIVYTAAQFGATGFTPGSGPNVFDTGVIGSNTNTLALSQIPIWLPGTNTTYRAYVQVVESNNIPSAWAFTPFTVSYSAPNATTPVATAGTDPSTSCPRVAIVASTTTTGTVQAILLRSDGVYVRGASSSNPYTIPSGGVITIYDYEITPTVAYTYQLQVIKTAGTVITGSVPTTSNSVTVTSFSWWEFDPNTVSTATNAQVVGWQSQRTEQSTARLVLGQQTPNVVTSTMGGIDGSATFETFDPTTYSKLQQLLISQTTIFVSSPWGPTDTTYVRFGPQSGGGGGGGGTKVQDSSLLPSSYASMHRTTNVTWVAQARPPV